MSLFNGLWRSAPWRLQKNSLLLHNLGARWSKCSKICSWRSFWEQTKDEPFLFLAIIQHQYICDKRKRSPPKAYSRYFNTQKLLTCMREDKLRNQKSRMYWIGGKILKANKKILSQCYCLWCSFLLFWYSLRRFQNCLCKLRFPIRFYQF